VSPQYPNVEDVLEEEVSDSTETEPVFKSVEFHYGKDITGDSRVYGWYKGSDIPESQLDILVKWGELIAKIHNNYVTMVAVDSEGFRVMHGCAISDFDGEFSATVEMAPHGPRHAKRRVAFMDNITEVDRVKSILLDRRYEYSQLCTHYFLKGSDAMYMDVIYNDQPKILIGPHRASELRQGDITSNYERLYAAVGEAITNTSIANYDLNSGVYRYLLLDQEALGENIERLERVLRRAGWSKVKFIVENRCLILELD
jgi:hypothetical protein